MSKHDPFAGLVKTNHAKPPRICFLGPGGVGKTTQACFAPSPIVVPTEDGLSGIEVKAFDQCLTLADYEFCINKLLNTDHNHKSVIIDSADWLDDLVHKKVAADHDVETTSDIGYGKAGGYLIKEWRKILATLDQLRNKGMLVIFTAHSKVQKIEDPRHGAYDKFTLKMHKDSAGVLEEWLDVILFCEYELHIKKEDVGFKKTKNRAIGTGDRVMYAVGSPTITAKNRYGLPEVMPLSWSAFEEEYKKFKKSKTPKPTAAEKQPVEETENVDNTIQIEHASQGE